MVKDSRPFSHRKRLKRKSSWKDTLRGWASGGEDADEVPSPPRSSSVNWRTPHKTGDRRKGAGKGDGSLADAESSDEEDFNQYPEDARPLQSRVVYKYPNGGD